MKDWLEQFNQIDKKFDELEICFLFNSETKVIYTYLNDEDELSFDYEIKETKDQNQIINEVFEISKEYFNNKHDNLININLYKVEKNGLVFINYIRSEEDIEQGE